MTRQYDHHRGDRTVMPSATSAPFEGGSPPPSWGFKRPLRGSVGDLMAREPEPAPVEPAPATPASTSSSSASGGGNRRRSRPRAPSTGDASASGGGGVGGNTSVVFVPDHLRDYGLPETAPDLIAPDVAFPMKAELHGRGPVSVHAEAGSPVTIDGQADKSLSRSGAFVVTSSAQSPVGSGTPHKLVAMKGETVLAETMPFAVAAIATQSEVALDHHGHDDANRRYDVVVASMVSGNGPLDAVSVKEHVAIESASGAFSDVGLFQSRDFHPAAGAVPDNHYTPDSALTGEGAIATRQVLEFKDARSGATGVVQSSGFRMLRRAHLQPDGRVKVRLTKTPAAVSVDGLTALPGVGGVAVEFMSARPVMDPAQAAALAGPDLDDLGLGQAQQE